MEERIVELEARYMEIQRTLEELSSVVAEHERTLERLTVQLSSTTARLRDLSARTEGPLPDEKPPHY